MYNIFDLQLLQLEPVEEGGQVVHLINTPVEVDFVTPHSDCAKALKKKEKKAN